MNITSRTIIAAKFPDGSHRCDLCPKPVGVKVDFAHHLMKHHELLMQDVVDKIYPSTNTEWIQSYGCIGCNYVESRPWNFNLHRKKCRSAEERTEDTKDGPELIRWCEVREGTSNLLVSVGPICKLYPNEPGEEMKAGYARSLTVANGSRELCSEVVLDMFDFVHKEMIADFKVDKELAKALLPFVMRALDGTSLTEFLQRREAMMRGRPKPASFIIGGNKWLTHARNITNCVMGNIRSAVVVFREGTEHASTMFKMISNEDGLRRELGRLIEFTFGNFAGSESFPNEDVWQRVPDYLHQLVTLEAPNDLYGHSDLIRFVVFRMFDLQKMQLLDVSSITSVTANILHLGRLGTVSVCGLLDDKERKAKQFVLAEASKNSDFVQFCSQALAPLRGIEADRRNTREHDEIRPNGDLFQAGRTYKSKIYTNLIPILTAQLSDLFSQLCRKEVLDFLVDPGNSIKTHDGTIEGGFTVLGREGQVLLRSDLILWEEDDKITVDKITAICHMVYQGTGYGATRASELEKLSCLFIANQIRFWRRGDKRPSWNAASNKMIEGRLSPSLSRLVLLYHTMLPMLQYSATGKISSEFDIGWAVQHVFQLETKPNGIAIRKAFTGFTDILMKEEDRDPAKLKAVANQSGHSSVMHTNYYGTMVAGQDQKYKEFHRGLGEPNFTFAKFNLTMDDLSQCLKKVLGNDNARFNPLQEAVLQALLDGSSKSIFAILSCGIGKSMLFILFAVASELFGVPNGCSILVVPYEVLLQHALLDGQEKQVDILALHCDDIKSGQIPACLNEGLPDILVMTTDTFTRFTECCSGYLETWMKRGILSRVFFDEVHVLFTEFGFREVFRKLPVTVKDLLGCVQLIFLTGTLPRNAEEAMAKWLNISNPLSYRSETLGLNGIPVSVVDYQHGNYNVIVDYVGRRLSAGGSVQIFCATRTICREVNEAIDKLDHSNPRFISGEVNLEERKTICGLWKRNKCNVLTSTSMGFVGNQNDDCRTIICIGHLRNPSAIVQTMGRLRKSQRDGCETHFYVTEHDRTKYAEPEDNHWVEKSEMSYDGIQNFIGPKLVTDFYNTKECRIQNLSVEAFGMNQPIPCGTCDNCNKKPPQETPQLLSTAMKNVSLESNTIFMDSSSTDPIETELDNTKKRSRSPTPPSTPSSVTTTALATATPTQASTATAATLSAQSYLNLKSLSSDATNSDPSTQLLSEDSNKKSIDYIYHQLRNLCLVCQKKTCDGQVCLRNTRKCYTCGKRQHPIGTPCPVKFREALKGMGVCFNCAYPGEYHPKGTCPTKYRIRRLLMETEGGIMESVPHYTTISQLQDHLCELALVVALKRRKPEKKRSAFVNQGNKKRKVIDSPTDDLAVMTVDQPFTMTELLNHPSERILLVEAVEYHASLSSTPLLPPDCFLKVGTLIPQEDLLMKTPDQSKKNYNLLADHSLHTNKFSFIQNYHVPGAAYNTDGYFGSPSFYKATIGKELHVSIQLKGNYGPTAPTKTILHVENVKNERLLAACRQLALKVFSSSRGPNAKSVNHHMIHGGAICGVGYVNVITHAKHLDRSRKTPTVLAEKEYNVFMKELQDFASNYRRDWIREVLQTIVHVQNLQEADRGTEESRLPGTALVSKGLSDCAHYNPDHTPSLLILFYSDSNSSESDFHLVFPNLMIDKIGGLIISHHGGVTIIRMDRRYLHHCLLESQNGEKIAHAIIVSNCFNRHWKKTPIHKA